MRSTLPHTSTLLILLACAACAPEPDPLSGAWEGVLDLAGGPLPFALHVDRRGAEWSGRICNGPSCGDLSAIVMEGDSVRFEIADFDATVTARFTDDSLTGMYRNVGNRGPRAIAFHARRGTWETAPGSDRLLGSWDATFITDQRRSPRVFEIRNGEFGLEGSLLANSGDYGVFWGQAVQDSFFLAHFDGSFVYLIAGRLDPAGDTLRGVFHAGARTQTPWIAVRSTGAPHLTPPLELTQADTTNRFQFAFPDLEGRLVDQDDPRFQGKVLLVDIFGSWCTTCHDAAPDLVRFYREFHDRGLEVVGLAYEVTGDTAIDNRQVRRFRDKFSIPYTLLLAGLNTVEATAATLPQLHGFTAYPTTLFIGRDGRIKRVYAGFVGPATGALHTKQVETVRSIIEGLLASP